MSGTAASAVAVVFGAADDALARVECDDGLVTLERAR
jgi:hypothetical protein